MLIFDGLTGLKGCGSGCLGFALYEARFRHHATYSAGRSNLLESALVGNAASCIYHRRPRTEQRAERASISLELRNPVNDPMNQNKPEGTASGEVTEET